MFTLHACHTATAVTIYIQYSAQKSVRHSFAILTGCGEYVGGMARTKRVPLLAAGGTENHLHLLFNLPTTMTVAEAVQFFKGNTSRWMNQTGGRFGWQEGYGAFSVGRSQRARVTRYIDFQIEHHKKWSFEDEFVALLKSYDIAYDPQYVFGWPLPGLRHSPHGARGPQR